MRVEADISQLWDRWDRNGDGHVTFAEFQQNVFPYILQHYRGAAPAPAPAAVGEGEEVDPELAEVLREIARIDDVYAVAEAAGAQGQGQGEGRTRPPSLRQPREWFQYWDEDGSGHLDKVHYNASADSMCAMCAACRKCAVCDALRIM